MSVHAPILQVSEIARGDSVGYGETFRATKPMRIATLGIGYANGYLRSLGNRGVAGIAGTRVPVVGRVSMDLVTVDVSGLADAALASGWAQMLGSEVGLTELARLAGTNEYEMQIALGRGCRRTYG
jgi:alanine racemase